MDPDQEKINRQVQEMLSCVSNFKEQLVQDVPQHLNINGIQFNITDLSEEEQNYYNTFVQENFNKTITNYTDQVNVIIEKLQSNDMKIKNDEIYNSYYFFKWKKKNLLYKLEKISYTIDVDIYQEPLRYEYFDRNDEEWYPTNSQENILNDLSSCANNQLFENISLRVKEIAWYGLMECISNLYDEANHAHHTGYYLVYRDS